MTNRALFLHLTDPHLSAAGVLFARDDQKVVIPGNPLSTREPALDLMLRRLGQRLAGEGRVLDACCSPATPRTRASRGGHELVLRLLLDHLGSVGVTADRCEFRGNPATDSDLMPATVPI